VDINIVKSQLPKEELWCYFGKSGFKIATSDNFDYIQTDYRVDWNGKDITGDEEGDWQKSWYVIGNDLDGVSPVFVDIEEQPLRVYIPKGSRGSWKANLVSESLEGFICAMEYIQSLGGEEETFLYPHKDMLTDEKKLTEFFDTILSFTGEESSAFWREFIDEHKHWLEEYASYTQNELSRLIQKALNYHRNDENIRAVEILESEVFTNNPEALLLLGDIYSNTDKRSSGLSRDNIKARDYWIKSHELGNNEASRNLADMYYWGTGKVRQNRKESEAFWKVAHGRGDEMATSDLANYYYDDKNEDIDQAIEMYKQLIEKSEFLEDSCTKLGRIYYRGIGVSKDFEKAFYWSQKGALLGAGNCLMDLSLMYYRGDYVKKSDEKAIALVKKAGRTEWIDNTDEVIAFIKSGKTI